ncbi:hypothetical protein LRP50_12350 [Enterovibrio sp. ZSDZ42]|uniref:Uncharacterized protein n=1 Tax=Enterovibrio gelatinilyticus TaxID=2899819 RepID=A0ABT5R0Y3_9GAMM|nr:hypothetical protein [Enterovibrio sp. ZSDZ42]MDD1793926.1 hypothetical protein [Enterovibrio sp. ZSDZ42]
MLGAAVREVSKTSIALANFENCIHNHYFCIELKHYIFSIQHKIQSKNAKEIFDPRLKMPTSFMSEHSAEFALVPSMRTLLKKSFSTVIPIYPWLSREFGRKSQNYNDIGEFKVIALFPRRPKLIKKDILFTINHELIEYSNEASKHGVLTIAGLPLVRSLLELDQYPECLWFELTTARSGLQSTYDAETYRLSESVILSILKDSKVHTMSSLENFVRHVKHITSTGFFGAKYKPVFFLVKE